VTSPAIMAKIIKATNGWLDREPFVFISQRLNNYFVLSGWGLRDLSGRVSNPPLQR
jgi:hypothetical protein